MAVKTVTKKKAKKLNNFTEEKNHQPPVKVEEAKNLGEIELPETQSIVPIKEFAMPIATPEQLQQAMELYQRCVNALIKTKDIVMVEGTPHGKKIAVNKINRVFGVSTEVLRSFEEERIANKDFWSKGARKWVLVKKGEKYTVAKAWVKAILPNGQYCTRGGAVSETERRFAHFPHDLLATAETRAMKNAATNLLGIEFEMVEEQTPPAQPAVKAQSARQGRAREETYVSDVDGKTYKRRIHPNGTIEDAIPVNGWKPRSSYRSTRPSSPDLPATAPQKAFIKTALDKIDLKPEDVVFRLSNQQNGKQQEYYFDELNKGTAWDLIELIKKGKDKFEAVVDEISADEKVK